MSPKVKHACKRCCLHIVIPYTKMKMNEPQLSTTQTNLRIMVRKWKQKNTILNESIYTEFQNKHNSSVGSKVRTAVTFGEKETSPKKELLGYCQVLFPDPACGVNSSTDCLRLMWLSFRWPSSPFPPKQTNKQSKEIHKSLKNKPGF